MRVNIKTIIGIIVLVFCFGASYQFISTKLDAIKYPIPGKLVDIGGYKLHIHCSGQGKPSVILDAGGNGFSLVWTLVQPEIAKFAHVCSYDRAGMGWSEMSPLSRTSQHMVKELHDLLHNAGIATPYILVGHSLGGINMRLYANTYPDEVFGLVLVDSSHELQIKRIQELTKSKEIELPCDQRPAVLQRALQWIAFSYLGQISGMNRLYLRSTYKDFTVNSPESIRPAYIARLLVPSSSHTMAQEGEHFAESLKQLETAKNLLDDKPLIVVTRGKAVDPTDPKELCKYLTDFNDKIWLPLQKDLVSKSTRGKQVIAEKSCHMIPYCQPEIIVAAVKEIVDEYKNLPREK